MSAGLTDAEDYYVSNGWSGCDGSSWATLTSATQDGWRAAAREARIKADAIATAREEERAKYKPLVHAARTIALMLDHYAQESTR